ncbi:MAG: helix-turn-helix transcriptional regulator [Acidimicrobiia bacterium]|nr:helix-turn-helix transcriptional regulator [Acidimicrobiia bacterium]
MGGDTRYGTAEFATALGHTIKVLRTDRGVERKDLADKAGLSYSHLAAIEAGQKQPSPQALVAIAEALGLRSHELLESVEMRRERTERRPGDPWWLTGDAAIQPAAMSVPSPAMRLAMNPPTEDLADFVREITDLAEHLGIKERAAILHLARKLADPKR